MLQTPEGRARLALFPGCRSDQADKHLCLIRSWVGTFGAPSALLPFSKHQSGLFPRPASHTPQQVPLTYPRGPSAKVDGLLFFDAALAVKWHLRPVTQGEAREDTSCKSRKRSP